MPEGPIIVILKEEVDALHLVGKKVLRISGTNTIDDDRIIGQKVLAIKTYGKNFLICFEYFTLRVHLMMFGTYAINQRKETKLQLSLQFEDAELNFYTTSLKIIDEDLDDVYDWKSDIMAEAWDPKAALKKIQAKPKALAADVILDQNIFTGAGNIIKNEVLYRVKIHPLSRVGAIPVEKLKELIKEVRNYSFDFLKWKKAKVLTKNFKIYEHKPGDDKIKGWVKEPLGKGKRITYYNPETQIKYE
ncbi:endonuclease [Pedobacter sp. MC2016-14]|uniref:DNA-formamidopyrimidine glycosylase family protein n=1 Tax=Pedobacter sp. MC2016-14 TaxID=2897327 RepID=UPI001E3B05B5|nr:DNA-formamidopyrimidine glycosylase family protein [Pedobacter sp. MC2016-14]MCD0489222.1 endonuclease [Pedobacter sp. MC2016-14]